MSKSKYFGVGKSSALGSTLMVIRVNFQQHLDDGQFPIIRYCGEGGSWGGRGDYDCFFSEEFFLGFCLLCFIWNSIILLLLFGAEGGGHTALKKIIGISIYVQKHMGGWGHISQNSCIPTQQYQSVIVKQCTFVCSCLQENGENEPRLARLTDCE